MGLVLVGADLVATFVKIVRGLLRSNILLVVRQGVSYLAVFPGP